MKTCPSCQLRYPDDSTFCFVDGQTLQAADDALIGSTIGGRYRLEELVGQTPWARTYRARHRLVQQAVTVKLFPGLTADGAERFRAALALARRSTHPHILEVEGGDTPADGPAYVAHKWVDAQPLSKTLGRGPLGPERTMGLAVQLLRAIARIHDFGGVHGGIKPSNILVGAGDRIWAMDVGLGRSLVRTPWEDDPTSFFAQCYQAPELNSAQRNTAAADLYAVGVIAFQGLTGRLPFDASDVKELRALLGEHKPLGVAETLPGMHEQVTVWLERMLARFPDKRPANAHQAFEELSQACEAMGIAVAPLSPMANGAIDVSLDPVFARWGKYRGLFGKMLELGFPSGAPDSTRTAYETLCGKVDALNDLGQKAVFQCGTIGDIVARAHEGRERIAEQMDAINEQAKAIRAELRPLQIASERHGDKAVEFPDKALEAHKEVIRWEGRSAFREPYRELAEAYRTMAGLYDKWWGVRSAQLSCDSEASEKSEQLNTLDAQLDELREALRVHESNLSAELASCEQSLAELGQHADAIEPELLGLATRFSAPLRSKPELGGCFRELTQIV